jgi:hypothetical protein
MTPETDSKSDDFPWAALVGGAVGVGLIVLAFASWQQVNEYALTAHSPSVTPPPLADFSMTLAKPVVPLFEGGSGKGSPAAYARAIQATLAAMALLGVGVLAASILVRNAQRSA